MLLSSQSSEKTIASSVVPSPTGSATDGGANSKQPPTDEQKQAAEKRADELFNQLQTLVKEFYPKAQCSQSKSNFHFEFKTKNEIGYYSQREEKAPQEGGILGELTLNPGQFEGKLLSEQQAGFHTNLMLVPDSTKENFHIVAKLSYPSDMSPEFKERFAELVNAFGKN